MKLSKILDINLEKTPKVLIGSSANVGKTTLLSILAAEFYMSGKKVLFLSEENVKVIHNKIKKHLDGSLNIHGSVKITSFKINETELETFFKNDYNLIIVDNEHLNIEALYSLSIKYNIPIISSIQLGNYSFNHQSSKPLQLSDKFMTIKKLNREKKWYHYLLFWKKKPNIILNVVKNRYGVNFTQDLYVDFQNLKIKKC
jgi:hypothetical protein